MSAMSSRPPLLCALALASLLPLSTPAADASSPEMTITRISVGSCHRTGANSEAAFTTIAAAKPDVFLFIGDVIYGDTKDMAVLKQKYAALDAVPAWQKLRSSTRILGMWDDHDYGENDAGTEYPMKKESAAIFRDFFALPADHPSRKRAGVYHSAVFGLEGKRVQIVLLDARYFRSPIKQERISGKMTYIPEADPGKTFLGAEQWAWLEKELKEPADLRLIASGIQIIPEEHRFEKWANLPLERQRLLDTVSKASGKIVLLSGDRHMGEISSLALGGKTLVEMTTSGMTHAGGGRGPGGDEPNRHRIGNVVASINSGRLAITWAEGKEPGVELTIVDKTGAPVQKHAW
jgi:alkaline phosphatase D